MTLEELKERKKLLEKNFEELRKNILTATQNSLRVEGAIIDVSEIIADEEAKENKKEKHPEKKDKVKK